MVCKKILVGILAFSFSVIFNTAAFSACSSNICVGEIERLYTNSAGLLYIATDGDETALDCNAVANVYITLPADDEHFNQKYALLLTAMSLNKTVGLRIINGSDNCSLSYVYVEN